MDNLYVPLLLDPWGDPYFVDDCHLLWTIPPSLYSAKEFEKVSKLARKCLTSPDPSEEVNDSDLERPLSPDLSVERPLKRRKCDSPSTSSEETENEKVTPPISPDSKPVSPQCSSGTQ